VAAGSWESGFAGAWDERWWHEPFVVPDLPEGGPVTKPVNEDAAHFLIRNVRKYPHQVTIYEGGPMTTCSRDLNRPGVPTFGEGTDLHGRKFESPDGRP